MTTTLWRNARLATLAPLPGREPWGWIGHGALLTEGDTIRWVGGEAALPAGLQAEREVDLGGALLTPGLVDCHTHLVFGGDRAEEFEQRLGGASYEDIARAGGGIASSVRRTRAASEEALLRQSLPRARALLRDGVTTLEIKSGYGLDREHEAKMLRVEREIGAETGLDVRRTFLGAHAVPAEFAGRQADYVDEVCIHMLPTLAREGLVDAVDAFCEKIAFTPSETRRVFETARGLGLPVKLHADQLSDLGGAALAAEFGALSADHLEYTDEAGVRAMAQAGTVAVLLPAAFYALRETRLPPIESFRRHDVPMAVASDLNPGTSPILSLRLAMNLACTLFRLTPEEALRGATLHAARALGLNDRGTLQAGRRADFVVWDIDHPAELCYWIGGALTRAVYAAGRRVHAT